MNISALTLAAALTLSGAAFAESPFVGSWKMDVAKSTFTGETMTYTKTATGYHFSNGSTFSYDFADDGKPYTTMIAGRTATWTKTGDGAWDMVFAIDGKTLTKAHRTLSPDGSTMTTTYEEYRPDGTTVHESDTYKRISGASGLEGKWEDIKVDAAPDTLMISKAAPMTYKVEYPTQKVTFLTHTDRFALRGHRPDRAPRRHGDLHQGRRPQVELYQQAGRQGDGRGDHDRLPRWLHAHRHLLDRGQGDGEDVGGLFAAIDL